MPVDITRTGYTGDLGYEVWMPWDAAIRVWDAIAEAGRAFDLHPTGMLALDVARVEAGLLLIDVDFHSSRKAMIESQKYSPFELGMARLVDLGKGRSSGAPRSPPSIAADHGGRSSVSRSTGPRWKRLYEAVGLPPTAPAAASRVAVPVYKDGRQVGRATSTTWSTMLKKLIALATIDAPHYADRHDACSSRSPSRPMRHTASARW